MAKQSVKEFKLPLELSIDQSTYEKLVKAVGSEQISDSVKSLLEEFLIQYSQGGFVVSANDISRMSDAAGEPVSSSYKVVELVDKASSRKAGAHEFAVSVDPNMVDSFNDVAISKGMTLGEIVQEAWQSACAEGWFYAVNTPCQHFIISEGQHAILRGVLKKTNFTGSDLFNKIVSKEKDAK